MSHTLKETIQSTIQSEVISYEIIDGGNNFVTAYSADLKKNTKGLLDGLKLAKDAVKYKHDYKIVEIYKNGYRKLLEI
jgi:hypothetical protein